VEAKIEKMAADTEPAREAFDKIASGNAEPDDIDKLLAAIGQPEIPATVDEGFAQVPSPPDLPPDTDPAKVAELHAALATGKDWRNQFAKGADAEIDEDEQLKIARARFLELPEGRPLAAARNALSDDVIKLPEIPAVQLPDEAKGARPQPRPSLKVDDLVA